MTDAEAMWVAAGLRRDFEAAGINLPEDRRAAADRLAASTERLRMVIGERISLAAVPVNHTSSGIIFAIAGPQASTW